MIERTLFTPEHESFRDSFRRFVDEEITPFHAAWEDQGYVDRDVWRKAGANGFLCMTMPEEYGGAQAAIDGTIAYVNERKVFGAPVASYQNTRYKLAELQTEVQVARVFVDRCTELLVADQLDTATASMAKYWTTELQCKVVDECVQLHGGYGYMWEYPIARAYADVRVQRIYGGTTEIMKEVISRSMGLAGR